MTDLASWSYNWNSKQNKTSYFFLVFQQQIVRKLYLLKGIFNIAIQFIKISINKDADISQNLQKLLLMFFMMKLRK